MTNYEARWIRSQVGGLQPSVNKLPKQDKRVKLELVLNHMLCQVKVFNQDVNDDRVPKIKVKTTILGHIYINKCQQHEWISENNTNNNKQKLCNMHKKKMKSLNYTSIGKVTHKKWQWW